MEIFVKLEDGIFEKKFIVCRDTEMLSEFLTRIYGVEKTNWYFAKDM